MRLNFKKISALVTGTLMVGMTMGGALAANYPAPFVQNGAANVAIVYGTGEGYSPLDVLWAGNIQSDLQARMGTGSGTDSMTTTSGGDSVELQRSSDKVNLGDDVANTFTNSVTKDDLKTLLADGTYMDADNTEYKYTQKVTLGSNLDVTHFSDSDYDSLIGASQETPVIGIHFLGSTHVLNYTLDFTTNPSFNAATLETTTIKLLGRDYYVLDVTNGTTNKTTLLDTATTVFLAEGETQTVTLGDKTYDVSISYIGDTAVKLTVNGEQTNSLGEGGTFKLSDGVYVGIKDILYSAKDTGVSKVEFSLGVGKLELTDKSEIQLNDKTITEITSFLTMDSSSHLDKIVLMWTTDDEAFLTPDPKAQMTMPGFEALKLQMADYTIPSEENTTVEGGSTYIQVKTPIKEGDVTIPILYTNSTGLLNGLGKDSNNKLWTSNQTSAVLFNQTSGDKYFVASWNATSESESYYIKADVTTDGDNVNNVRFVDQADPSRGDVLVTNGSSTTFGSVTLTVDNITKTATEKSFRMSINSGGSFNTLYTKEGMKMYLPYNITSDAANTSVAANAAFIGGISLAAIGGNASAGRNSASYNLFFDDADKDGKIGGGHSFNMTLAQSGTTGKLHVSTVTTDDTGLEIGSTNNYEYYVIDDLATKIIHDTGGDYDSAMVTYHGGQFYVNLFLTAPETTVTSTPGTPGSPTPLGEVIMKDSEVSSASGKNLIVVGGSCINSAAATLVGGQLCGSAWTEKTGVGTGQFLIKGYTGTTETKGLTSKLALLVAGYEYPDTVNAAKYLKSKTVDTSKEYKGTTAESAELVTTTA